jgi:hypothetical protein
MVTRSDLGVYVITSLAQLAQSRQLAGVLSKSIPTFLFER